MPPAGTLPGKKFAYCWPLVPGNNNDWINAKNKMI
jgi:hypothetical protein